RLHVLELGVGAAPFLSCFSLAIEKSTSLHVTGVDTLRERRLAEAKHNVAKALDIHGNPEDSMDIRSEDWNMTLASGRKYDVVYFNPPYLPAGEEVRNE